jgi:chaperonin cofactor prefoldin
MFPGVDHLKAQTMFHYCAKSTRKLVERDYVRQELENQIKKLQKIGNKDVKNQMVELERKIAAAIALEQKISGHQTDEDVFHRKLRDRIEQLEKRLGTFLDSREARANRVKELEEKIVGRLATRSQKIALVRDDIEKLEKMHGELEKQNKSKSRLQQIDEKLHDLKDRLRQLESS